MQHITASDSLSLSLSLANRFSEAYTRFAPLIVFLRRKVHCSSISFTVAPFESAKRNEGIEMFAKGDEVFLSLDVLDASVRSVLQFRKKDQGSESVRDFLLSVSPRPSCHRSTTNHHVPAFSNSVQPSSCGTKDEAAVESRAAPSDSFFRAPLQAPSCSPGANLRFPLRLQPGTLNAAARRYAGQIYLQ